MNDFAEKHPQVDAFIQNLMGKNRTETIMNGHCMTCNNEFIADNFRDELSEKEYSISGMCQECQDNVFGGDK